MPDKYALASYLVTLHNLLEAQSKAVGGVPNATLAEEYKKHWELLKDTIRKENDNAG